MGHHRSPRQRPPYKQIRDKRLREPPSPTTRPVQSRLPLSTSSRAALSKHAICERAQTVTTYTFRQKMSRRAASFEPVIGGVIHTVSAFLTGSDAVTQHSTDHALTKIIHDLNWRSFVKMRETTKRSKKLSIKKNG
jgi:hypothetical protein